MFSATHSRTKKSKVSGQVISQHSLLAAGDKYELKGPGVLLYTKNMPFMLLSNLNTPLGLVNGKLGRAVDFVEDPTGKPSCLAGSYGLEGHCRI